MKPLTIADLTPFESYERTYPDIRARIITLKQSRRVRVGELVSFVFENRETVLFQVQEMIRVERILEPRKIQDELDTYNALLPQAGELSATMLIEITDPRRLKDTLDNLMGIDEDNVVSLRVGSLTIPGIFERGRSKEDKISAVHFVTFHPPDETLPKLQDHHCSIRLVIEHRWYNAETVLSWETRQALAEDLKRTL